MIEMIGMIGIDNQVMLPNQTLNDREVKDLDVVRMTATDPEEIGTIVAGIEVDLGTESRIISPLIIIVDQQLLITKTPVRVVI